MMRVMVVEDEEMIRKGIVMAVDWATLKMMQASAHSTLTEYKSRSVPALSGCGCCRTRYRPVSVCCRTV